MKRQSITVVTAEAAEVVTLAEAKAFLRVDGSDEDDLITDMLDAAIEEAKNYTRRSLVNRTLKLTLDHFPASNSRDWWDGVRQAHVNVLHGRGDVIEMPFPNLVSVTSLVTYDDADASSTFSSSNYQVDTAGNRVILKSGKTWPSDLRDHAAIEITYVSGYGATASAVPAGIRQAIKAHVQEMYEMREFCEVPEKCRKLLSRYRVKDALTFNG